MINYLKGILISKVEAGPFGCNIIIEVNNIGYLVLTNKKVVASLPNTGETVVIYTYLVHKEDTMYLCGFTAREDRDLFSILQSVSGIGTKVALLLLGEFGAQELISIVIRGDHKALSKTKGIGAKLAQRIILELKDKMTNWRDKIEPAQIQDKNFESDREKESFMETESVLMSLGYSRDEINQSLENAILNAQNKDDSEELLRFALQWLANH